MEYVVMDLEFNQPFNFESGEKMLLVEECPFEIIQIGIVRMNKWLEITDKRSFMIKPQLYNRMHPFVEKITGLKRAMFDGEKTLPEVYDELLNVLKGEEDVICVWGDSDIKLLYRNLMFYKLSVDDIPRKYINVQQMASARLKLPAGMNIGLKNAVEALDIPITSAFHNAVNDAEYTALIFESVHTKDLPVHTFDLESLNREKTALERNLDTKGLYAETERIVGHKLSRKEKNLVKKIYSFGRAKRFDLKKR